MRETADTKAREKGGRGGARDARDEVPLQPMEDHGEANIHTAAYGGAHVGAGRRAFKGAVSLHTRAGS